MACIGGHNRINLILILAFKPNSDDSIFYFRISRMEAKLPNKRPKHLNLFKIKQPLPAVVSILHRISGVLLFFPGIPLLVYGLQMLLQSPQSFDALVDYFRHPMIKLALLLPIWFFLHHLCAGVRHLLLDLHIGVALPQARASSKLVFAIGFVLTALAAGFMIW